MEFRRDVWRAVKKGDMDDLVTALTLSSRNIDIPKSNNKKTSTYVAAKNGHVAIIKKLVEFGSTAIDTPNKCGRTPMHAAAAEGHVSVVKTLFQLGSQTIDARSHSGWTPMLTATFYDRVSIIKVLVQLGSQAINTSSYPGTTPISLVNSICDPTGETLKYLGASCTFSNSYDEIRAKEIRDEVFFSTSLLLLCLNYPQYSRPPLKRS